MKMKCENSFLTEGDTGSSSAGILILTERGHENKAWKLVSDSGGYRTKLGGHPVSYWERSWK